MPELSSEWLMSRLEKLAEERVLNQTAPVQEFADQVRQLREQLGLSVDEFSERYNISTLDIITAELSRGVVPSAKMKLLIEMIRFDPKKVAGLIEQARKRTQL